MSVNFRTALDIALRDMLRSTRSLFAVMFAFVVPLTIVGIMYLTLGGLASGEPTLPQVEVRIVNLDTGPARAGSPAAGSLVVDLLQSGQLTDLLNAIVVPDEATARAAVASGEAAVAVILPASLSASLYGMAGEATVRLIQDPTLTISPGIVRAIVEQFLDGFSGAQITVQVLTGSLRDAGVAVDPAVVEGAVAKYVAWAEEAGVGLRDGQIAFASVQPVTQEDAGSPLAGTLSKMMAAMLVVYVFYTGSAAAQSILREQEEGTLQRLFTAPVTIPTVLVGKVMASVLTLVAQSIVLLVTSGLVFGVAWGAPLPMLLASVALIAVASTFGIFVMSFVTHENQVGVVYGAVMTITGLFGTYAYFLPLPDAFRRWALVVPQGWAMRAWDIVVNGGRVGPELLLSVGVCFALAALFLTVGAARFGRRFARRSARRSARSAGTAW
jgi:ABC-2 type transport system permease protein